MTSDRYTDWTYVCQCTQCKWSAEWVDEASWEKGAARRHADIYNHAVKTTSTKIVRPEAEVAAKKPTEKDLQMGWCKECNKYIGVGAGRMFNAAVKSHEKRTYHRVDISPNPAFKKVRRRA